MSTDLQSQMNRLGKWIVGFMVFAGAAVLALDPLVDTHPHFHIEHSFSFYAWYGLVVSVGLVLLSVALRCIVKRKEDYYDK